MIKSAYGPEFVKFLQASSIPRTYEKNTEITIPEGEYRVGILVSGWVVVEQYYGTDHVISDLILPHDPMYRRSSAGHNADWTWQSRTEARVFWLKYEELSSLLLGDPTVRGCVVDKFFEMQAQTEERLRIATHYGAGSRLAYFIMETLGRLKRANAAIYDRFLCPLSQFELGSLLGMTNIHVSRSLTRLESEGLIKRHKSFIEVVDGNSLKKLYIPTEPGDPA